MRPIHLIEKRIQDAQERGEFDGLPGAGKPIPDLDQPYDELWWLRKWMEREGLDPAKELREEKGSASFAALFELRERVEEKRKGR